MPSQVYSRRFFAETVGTLGYDYTARPSVVTVLRDITFCPNTDADPVQVIISLTHPTSCSLIQLSVPAGFGVSSVQWTGRIVLNAGDTIHVAVTELLDVQATGYELLLP